MLAQFCAVAIGGAAVGFVGAALTVLGVAAALQTTEFDFLVSLAGVFGVLVASASAGAVGAVLGAGTGAVGRNTGGAVTGAVLALIIAPPLIVQLVNDASTWIPSALATGLAGVDPAAAGLDIQDSVVAAILGLAAWALIPALIGLVSVERRDVV